MENQKVFGSAYAVVDRSHLLYKKCFGCTSPDGNDSVTENTLFRLGSLTKPITAYATYILHKRKQLSLSDSVCKYLPEFKDIHIIDVDEKGNAIDLGKPENNPTIYDLLTHASGIGSNLFKFKKMTDEDKSTIDNSVKFLLKQGYDFEPATQLGYSEWGAFDVLVKIIEDITKMDYQSFLKKEIFEPLGMNNTVFIPSDEQWQSLIAMHNKVEGKSTVAQMKENCIFDDFPCTHFLGGTGIASTLADYIKFVEMILNDSKTPYFHFPRLYYYPLTITQKNIVDRRKRIGLGGSVIRDEKYQNLPIFSYVCNGAYGSHFWIDIKGDIAGIFLKNSLYDGGAGNESARNFEKAVYDSL